MATYSPPILNMASRFFLSITIIGKIKEYPMLKSIICLVLLVTSTTLWAGNITVNVKGMSCQMCVKKIKHEFVKLGKTESVEVDVEKGLTTISEKKDVKLTDDEIKEMIKNAGYEATEIKR
jgi:copper chaperone